MDPREVSSHTCFRLCRVGCSGQPSATRNPSKYAPRRPEIFRNRGKTIRPAAGEKIPPMSSLFDPRLVFGFLVVLLCVFVVFIALFSLSCPACSTRPAKNDPARVADCFLTHLRDLPRPTPLRRRHRLSPRIPTPLRRHHPDLYSPKCWSCHQPHRARTSFGRNPVRGCCSCPAPRDLVGRGPFWPMSCSRTTDLSSGVLPPSFTLENTRRDSVSGR